MREISLAILDLAQNSIDAGADLIKISIKLDDGFISAEIADNGCGMSDSEMESAFEAGVSFKGSTGLGLALLKQEVLMTGGEIEIESKVGHGTRIYFKCGLNCPTDIGDLGSTFVTLVDELYDTVFRLNVNGKFYRYDTRELKSSAGVADLQSSGALRLMREDINKKINGGAML